jgi:uncharacterized protein (TIGR02099 family)
VIHLFKSAFARTVTFTLIALVVSGLLVGAIRLVLPFADLFRAHLASALSGLVGLEVRLSGFRVRLAGMTPRITLEDVELVDPRSGSPQLGLMELQLDLDLAASLMELAPRVESLTLVGARLVVKRGEEGTISVAGLDGINSGNPALMTFFLARGRLLLSDSEIYWIDSRSAAGPLHLVDVRLRLDNRGSHHRMGMLARLHDDADSAIHLAADVKGESDAPHAWSGDLYIRWRSRDLEPLLTGLVPSDVSISSEGVAISSWHRISSSAVSASVARLTLEGLTGRREGAAGRAAMHMQRIGAMLRWRREQNGWALSISDLNLEGEGPPRPAMTIGVRYHTTPKASWSLAIGIQRISLADLHDALSPFAGPSGTLTMLSAANAGGALRDLRLRLSGSPQERMHWAAQGRLTGLRLDPVGRVPGIRGLDVAFVANPSRGRLQLHSDAFLLHAPWLFEARSPLVLERLSGSLSWRLDDAADLHIASEGITAENTDIRTQTRLRLTLPHTGDGPFLDLHTDFSEISAPAVRRYLPGGKLKERLERWLERAFVRGKIPRGGLLFRGKLSDFPFRQNQGRFEILFAVEDGALDFHRDWPRVEAVAGEVRFINSRMEISVSQARFLDSQVKQVQAYIPDLLHATAVHLRGTAVGPFSDGLRVLKETPLRRRLGRLADAFRVEGRSRLDLDLAIPLRHKGIKGPLRLRGALSWPEPAMLEIADYDLELGSLQGALSFTQSALSPSYVEAQIWNTPVRIFVETTPPAQGDAAASTQVRVAGRTMTAALQHRFPNPLWSLLQGETGWELNLDIPRMATEQPDDALAFTWESRLQGLGVKLPDPVGKPKQASRALRVEGRLIPGMDLDLRGRYGELGFHLAFARTEPGQLRLMRGTLAFGGGQSVPLPRSKGLHLTGSLPKLDLTAWTDWLSEQSRGGSQGDSMVRSADLTIGRARLPGMTCRDLHLTLRRQRDGWRATLDGSGVGGTLTVPHQRETEPVRVDLERLDLQTALEGAEDETSGFGVSRPTDPRRSHALDLRVGRLLWGENDLGQLTVRSHATAEGLEFTRIDFDNRPLMRIQGSGRWIVRAGEQETAVDLTAKGEDFGGFLRRLGYSSLLHQAPASAELHLRWPGGPGQFTLGQLDGEANAEVGEGTLLEVEPGVGRMLGVFNLGALRRRLSLDFSDVFERGYAFEKMTANLVIKHGRATIRELVIDGPSASVEISGQTDLVAQRFDQVVTVTPRIGTGVALAGAVAGGPLVGAAVLLADKVSGGGVDKLASYQYEVTGPWTDPMIRRRNGRSNGIGHHSLTPGGDLGGGSQGRDSPSSSGAEEGEPSTALPTQDRQKKRPPDANLFLEGH